MKRRQFLKYLGLAGSLPWVGRLALAAADAPQKADSASHKILTCNIRVDAPADARSGDSWADRKELCVEVMRAQKADLIGLQECQHVHLRYLKTVLPEFDTFALSHPDQLAYPLNAILYSRARYELISAGGFWLSETPHIAGSKSWDCAQSRFVNWVQLQDRAAQKQFRFWNTHLDHIGQVARQHQAELIVQASAVFPKDFPQLLTGDFNAGAANPAIQLVAAAGWTDAYAAVHGLTDPGFTAHAFLGPGYAEKKLKGKPGARIDWIWCRGPVKPLAAQVIRDGRNGHYPSDHYFVSAEVQMF
jgi:endonuclease/exonuclease/phosphatase family metal-dependent hydrolase